MVRLAAHAVSWGLQIISECCVKLQLWRCIAVCSVCLIYPSHVSTRLKYFFQTGPACVQVRNDSSGWRYGQSKVMWHGLPWNVGDFLTTPDNFIFSRQSLIHGYIEILWDHVILYFMDLFKIYRILSVFTPWVYINSMGSCIGSCHSLPHGFI
jgi:hypothetical protein